MNTQKIAVIFGGCSSEYQVSLSSAHAVIAHMDRKKYNPVMVGISRSGDWYYFDGNIEKIKSDTWCNKKDCLPAAFSPDRNARELLVFSGGDTKSIQIDAVFPVLHGKNGEDGTVQGLVELAGIPLVGCGLLASALCMDKDRAHKLASVAGVKVPKSYSFGLEMNPENALDLADQLGYPLYVKPVKAGSSLGITRVERQAELVDAIHLARQHDDQVIMEENIVGFEVGCAVMGNDKLIVGAVDEIESEHPFFDFEEKYTQNHSTIHVPARIPDQQSEEIKTAAKVIYTALGCKGFARVDLFVTPWGELVFNEVNTIPGFTAHSRFPTMMKAVGLSFEQVIGEAIELAAM
jgi:D-alanine---D-serine ligase